MSNPEVTTAKVTGELQEIIVKASITAFNTGYRSGLAAGQAAERKFLERAIDLNATSNEIGEFVYLSDLKDAIEELDAERKEKNLP